MAITNAYLVKTKNLEELFGALLTAKAPERFTNTFLANLGFKSSNDRLFTSVLKGLGFLDENSVPTQRYYDFLDESQSKRIVAEGIMEAYEDLFNINKKAYELPNSEIKGKLNTLTQGSKGKRVLEQMAKTFTELCAYADWNLNTQKNNKAEVIKENMNAPAINQLEDLPEIEKRDTAITKHVSTELHYNIQIHLPASRDSAVYDAIFQSIKKHLI